MREFPVYEKVEKKGGKGKMRKFQTKTNPSQRATTMVSSKSKIKGNRQGESHLDTPWEL